MLGLCKQADVARGDLRTSMRLVASLGLNAAVIASAASVKFAATATFIEAAKTAKDGKWQAAARLRLATIK